MKRSPLLALALATLGIAFGTFAQENSGQHRLLAFEKKSENTEDQIFLIIDGDFVSGTQFGSSEAGSAYGKLFGKVREDGLLHVTFNYEIEGQPGSVEQLMKLEEGRLTLAVGELEEHGPSQMSLKDPSGVTFTMPFEQAPLSLPEPDSDEGKAVLTPVDAAVSELTGVKCDLSDGRLRVAGDWAIYQGYLSAIEDKVPSDPEMAVNVAEREIQVQLKKDGADWKVVRSIFASATGSFDYEVTDDTLPPWQIFESLDNY